MTAPTIAISGIEHRFGSTRALGPISTTIGPGLTAIFGPNGSGKSTLLRLLATVAPRQSGHVVVGGLDPADPESRIALRRRLGYLPQEGGLPPRMRVADYLDYVGVLKEIEPARLRHRWAHWAMTRLELTDLAGRRIASLSGGVKRRVALAQALLGGPTLLLLDEPDAHLDPDQRLAINRLLRELAATTTIVVASHHPDELGPVADRRLHLRDGQLVQTIGNETS
jgi:ABC-2 type transport system ATP-binding protein